MSVRFIPTTVHGTLDYLASGVNFAAPALLRLEGAAALAPRVVGSLGAGYSLMTDYELGLARVVPMPAHLALDATKGVFLAASPWLFGFAKDGPRYWLPHVLLGASDVLAAAISKKG